MRKNIIAKVMKKSSDKTVSAVVFRKSSHSKYLKSFVVTKKYLVHDESNVAKVGDTILIASSRPISKRKSYVLVEVVKDKRSDNTDPSDISEMAKARNSENVSEVSHDNK